MESHYFLQVGSLSWKSIEALTMVTAARKSKQNATTTTLESIMCVASNVLSGCFDLAIMQSGPNSFIAAQVRSFSVACSVFDDIALNS